jgi:hypothetical protein
MVSRLFDRILDVWRGGRSWHSRPTLWFLVVLGAICALTALTGAVPTFIFGHDNLFFLENGWRALHGLRPHLDFWSSWGPLTFWVTGLGLKLSHASPNGLGYSAAIVALLVGLWTYRVGRGRLAPAPRALLAVYAAVLSCAPHPIGTWPLWLSPAMAYNRWGYALLVIVLVECFQRLEKPERGAEEWLGGVSTGAAVALALLLKASYFGVALGLIAASLFVWFPSVRRFLGMLAGFIALSFCGLAYLRFDLPAVLHALRNAAAARSQTYLLKTPLYAIEGQLIPLGCVLALAVAASFLKPRRREWLGELHLPLAAIVVYLGDIVLLTTNAQRTGLPLLGAFALLVANRLAESPGDSPSADGPFVRPYYASVLLLSGLLFLPQLAGDAVALSAAAVWKVHPPAACGVRFTESRISALLLCDRPNELQKSGNGSMYTTYVNEGVALLRRHCNPADKVLTMDMQNPFPYVLGWPPPRGGLASTSFNYGLSARVRPSFDEYFGDATAVMMPKHPAQTPEYLDGFNEIYAPAVEQRFRLAAESDWFRLYERK